MKNSNEDFKRELLNRTFQFSLNLIAFISNLNKSTAITIISNQVLRSGFSIGANIAEGQGAASRVDFKNFIQHAYKSSIETRYWLALLEKGNFRLNQQELAKLIMEARELSKILSSILLTLKGKKIIHS